MGRYWARTIRDTLHAIHLGKRVWGHITIANNVLNDVQTNIDIQKAREVSIVGNTIWQGL